VGGAGAEFLELKRDTESGGRRREFEKGKVLVEMGMPTLGKLQNKGGKLARNVGGLWGSKRDE